MLSPDVYAQEGSVESSEQVSSGTQAKDSESNIPSLTKATTKVDENGFNQGLINNPLQLIQGRVEGLIIAKPGSDPNGAFVSRIRGIQSIGVSSEPLIVIDGLPGAELSSVDPANIASIEVLKDIASSSLYGIRGGNGVILINTKSGHSGKSRARYRGSISFDMPDQNLSVMSANEYRGIFNNVDFGNNTDWMEEITRTGVSQVHNLSFSGGTERFLFYVAANYRKIEGIIKNSGFESFNGRMNLSSKFLNDRGKIEIMMATTTSTNQLGFNEVFKYAISGNPTLPIKYDGSPGTTNVGGYSERDIFDWFNPMSIIDQSVNNQDNLLLNGSLMLEYDFGSILEGLGSSIYIYNQSQRSIGGSYFPITSKFRNNYYNNRGMAGRTYDHDNNNMIDTRVYLERESSILKYSITGGYTYQYIFNEGFLANGGTFLTDAFLYNNLTAAQDFNTGLGTVASYANSHKLSAFYGLLSLNFNENFFLDASLRYEGSSRLGQDNKWHTFPSLSIGGRLDKLWNISGLDYLMGRISLGKAGRIPESSYLSLQRYDQIGISYQDGEYRPVYGTISNSNPDLGNETTSELNIGVDFAFGSGKINASFDWYTRTTKDMILPMIVPVPPNLYYVKDVNLGELKNSGIELRLDWNLITSPKWNYSTSLAIGTYNTTVISLSSGRSEFGQNGMVYKGDLGRGCGHATHRNKEGEPLGNFWGPVYTGSIMDGMPMMADLNGDGQYCDCDDDMTVIGNGLPDWTLGWGHSMSSGRFEINLFFRGVFGHDLYNEFRFDYENLESSTVGNWNIVNTEYFNPSLRRAMLSDLQVENASFFTLDNISVIYQLPDIPKAGMYELEIFVTGQNLIILTGYSGTDSEVRFTDESYFGRSPDQMVPGIDKENTFLPSKTITLGIRLGL
jgi:iron complex outermembrane receptor protein